MSALFSPITLRGLTLSNRIIVSPMCQYSAARGEATSWHLVHLGHLALSGAGMLCIEATSVEPEGRITPGDLGLWDDATEAALKSVLTVIRQYSRIPVTIQLAHAGRKASCHVPWEGGRLIPVSEGGWTPHAPSAIPMEPGDPPPLALDAAGMDRVRKAFSDAATRAARLGLDGIEVHGAHGYLIHEFLSPIANHRTDQYGGSLDNRFRFPLELFDIVRAAFPSGKPVGMRLSATDWMDDGWDIEQTVAFSKELTRRGADWITASSGGISPLQRIPVEPGYQVPFARRVKEATGATTIAVGMITEPQQAEDIVAGESADIVALARGMLYDPRWPWHAAAQLGGTLEAPPQYWRALPHEHKTVFGDTSPRTH